MPESRREAILSALDAAGITYRMVEHEAVHTVQAMERLHLDEGESLGATASNAPVSNSDLICRNAANIVFPALSGLMPLARSWMTLLWL